MAARSYEAIVLGLGGVGSAALYALAKRGVRALGVEQFSRGHDRGSSHGQTRVIRLAYFEHPDYVPLLHRAYALWAELEEQSGSKLYRETGVLELGPPEGEVLTGVEDAARMHGLPLERLDGAQVRARWPGFEVPDGFRAVLETKAGLLKVEDCVRAHLARAEALGATVKENVGHADWRADGADLIVTAGGETFVTRQLVIAAGAWSSAVLRDLGLPLQLVQKTMVWYQSPGPVYGADAGYPAFLYEMPEGIFYGLPWIDARGVKVAEHSGGQSIPAPLLPGALPPERETQAVEKFRTACLPRLLSRLDTAACMYTMTPDAHFVVDRHPELPGVQLAAGLSGHGFKLTSVLGEALAERVISKETALPIGLFALDRPALTPPRG